MTKSNIFCHHPDKLLGLHVIPEPREPHWQLRHPIDVTAYTGLLDWHLDHQPADSQVPQPVIDLLSHALWHRYRVTFLHPSASNHATGVWTPCEGGYCLTLPGMKPAWLTHRPDYPLFSTIDVEQINKCFHAEPFSWSLQQQLVFLSAKDQMPPNISYATLREALRDKAYKNLQQSGVYGLFYPAVDGDFAGFMLFDKTAWVNLLADLEQQCKIEGCEWSLST